MNTCIGLFLALSAHIGLDKSYNTIHPHIRCTTNSYITGLYYNSESEVSAYVGREYEISENSRLELGLVTGYEYKNVIPMIRYKIGQLFITPAYETIGHRNYGIVFGWEMKI
mgnify:CR=1 FL=1